MLNKKKIIKIGIANINNSFNNTRIIITDILGNTLCWASSGLCGFKGARKNTPFAAQSTAQLIIKKILEFGIKKLEIIVKGRGNGRDMAIRTLESSGLEILSIEDKTSSIYNGCRPPKKRKL